MDLESLWSLYFADFHLEDIERFYVLKLKQFILCLNLKNGYLKISLEIWIF